MYFGSSLESYLGAVAGLVIKLVNEAFCQLKTRLHSMNLTPFKIMFSCILALTQPGITDVIFGVALPQNVPLNKMVPIS